MKFEKCDVVKDLLPLYIDELCSKETAILVEEHVHNCDNCRKVLSEMKKDLKTPAVISKEELKKRRAPFKKIRNRVILLSICIVLLTVAATTGPSLYRELTLEKHHIDMNPNIEEIDFDQLTTELALTLNADNGKLYNLMGFDWIDIDRNGDILMFNTSFMIFRKNEPIHFQTRYKDNGQLEIRKSWGLEMSKGEAFSRIFEREPETFMELPLRFLGKIPWDHLKENLNLSDYDKIGISNDGTGDGQGNIWVEADALKTFLIDEKGNIIRFEEKTVVPSRDYQAINFSPAVYLNEHSSSGRMEVQYFFKTK